MLALAVRNTKKLVRRKVEEENVRLGRLFTKREQAALMARMAELPVRAEMRVLDPGAGTGILSAAAIEMLAKRGGVERILLTAYETDPVFLPMLKDNLERIRKKCWHDYKIRVVSDVREEHYLLAPREDTLPGYDIVLCNPPRELMLKGSPEHRAFRRICSGDTDLAFLFAARVAEELAEGGVAVLLLPVVLASSAYLEKLRRYLFERTALIGIHLFLKKATSENRLDEARKNMILALRRTEERPELIKITTSYGESGDIENVMHVDYPTVVREDGKSLLLLKSPDEAKVLSLVARFPATLSSRGLRMRTGLTLESRYKELLRDKPEKGTVPLIHPNSIQLGQISFPHPGVKNQYILGTEPSILQRNRNMLFIKRVPAKSDKKALFCGAYLASQLPRDPRISTHNKLNYIDYEDGREMDFNMVFGLFVVLNSSLYGKYYAIVSKSKQINATEFAALPLPSQTALRAMGAKLSMTRNFSERICDELLLAQMKSGKI